MSLIENQYTLLQRSELEREAIPINLAEFPPTGVTSLRTTTSSCDGPSQNFDLDQSSNSSNGVSRRHVEEQDSPESEVEDPPVSRNQIVRRHFEVNWITRIMHIIKWICNLSKEIIIDRVVTLASPFVCIYVNLFMLYTNYKIWYRSLTDYGRLMVDFVIFVFFGLISMIVFFNIYEPRRNVKLDEHFKAFSTKVLNPDFAYKTEVLTTLAGCMNACKMRKDCMAGSLDPSQGLTICFLYRETPFDLGLSPRDMEAGYVFVKKIGTKARFYKDGTKFFFSQSLRRYSDAPEYCNGTVGNHKYFPAVVYNDEEALNIYRRFSKAFYHAHEDVRRVLFYKVVHPLLSMKELKQALTAGIGVEGYDSHGILIRMRLVYVHDYKVHLVRKESPDFIIACRADPFNFFAEEQLLKSVFVTNSTDELYDDL